MSEQLSFWSAGYAAPEVDDIEGVLLGGGQLVRRREATASEHRSERSERTCGVPAETWSEAERLRGVAGAERARSRAMERSDMARLSVLARDQWRIDALLAAFSERHLGGEVGERGSVRTDFTAALAPLASRWLRGASQTVPKDLTLDGPRLRMWMLAAGSNSDGGYLLRIGDLDPKLVTSVAAKVGVIGGYVGARAGGPALRVTRAGVMARLRELAGSPPKHADWP